LGEEKSNLVKLYIAGKVSKDSSFGKHHWRDEFCNELVQLSGLELTHLDPLAEETSVSGVSDIFAKDCRLIEQSDLVVVYLSDDISVGGSQEILIARYLHKPVIALAPFGGKFNGCKKEMLGAVIEDFQDPFVFTTCDIVCGDVASVAEALKTIDLTMSTGMDIIDRALSQR
jgi:nucleoside 2-deoxyribosyltransferase